LPSVRISVIGRNCTSFSIRGKISNLSSHNRPHPMPIYYDFLPNTLINTIFFAQNETGVIAIDFGMEETEFVKRMAAETGRPAKRNPSLCASVREQITAYLSKERFAFDLPVDISSQPPFHQQVLHATMNIPRGQIATYGEIANRLNNPGSVRAVGQALGRNPIPLIIPCHRVVAASGKLGGYSGGGGVATKQKLLVLEGARLL